ncbi:MAG: hypothetical protein ACI8W8_001638 [Rhodothermales bacterium]|jgi:hypothetical protein
MGYSAFLSNGIYHRGGEFDGNIDFTIAFEPQVPMDAVLDNLRVVRGDDPQPCKILGYGENGDAFEFTVHAENFAYEENPTVQVRWLDQDLGRLELSLEIGEDSPEPRTQSGCGSAILLIGAGLFAILSKLL